MITDATPFDQPLANLVTRYINNAQPDEAAAMLALVEQYQDDPYLTELMPAAVEYIEVTNEQERDSHQKDLH